MNKGSSKKAQYMLTTIEVLVWQKDELKLSLPSLYSTDVTLKYYTILQICLQHYQNIKGQFAWIINSYLAFLFFFVSAIALMHVYVTQANFTTKPRFEIKNKRSFTEMNSQGSRVEKNTHAQKVQMQKILFTNEACWWNLLVWRNHA